MNNHFKFKLLEKEGKREKEERRKEEGKEGGTKRENVKRRNTTCSPRYLNSVRGRDRDCSQVGGYIHYP